MPKKLGLVIIILILTACSGKPTQPATTTVSPMLPSATLTQPIPRINITASGTIRQDEAWQGEIHLTGDIQLANGTTLTIEPGTTVYLASNNDDQGTGGKVSTTTFANTMTRLARRNGIKRQS
jgi:hypothetical protein